MERQPQGGGTGPVTRPAIRARAERALGIAGVFRDARHAHEVGGKPRHVFYGWQRPRQVNEGGGAARGMCGRRATRVGVEGITR